jgi:hypothetical protein
MGTASAWAAFTQSPRAVQGGDARVVELATGCGARDAVLDGIAAEIVGEEMADADQVTAMLRARGEPHVRPRIVRARGNVVAEQLAKAAGKQARCGIAFAKDGAMTAVVVDGLADLEPLPMQARTGQWLTFGAVLHTAVTGARLVVLGPRGLPRTVPTSVRGGRAEARFALDRPGAFTVQLVGDLPSGPRPLLEARVFADVPPSDTDDVGGAFDDVESFTAEARKAEGLGRLARDPRLDELARGHAEAMMRAHAVQHDLGDGDFATRFEAAGLSAKVVGENVARGRSIQRAVRALYASPSHRMNLLRADYTHLGVAVVSDDTHVYVCQVFAGALFGVTRR